MDDYGIFVFIGLIAILKLLVFIYKVLNGNDQIDDDNLYSSLSSAEKLKLADEYCYSNKMKEAKKLLKNIIKTGTKKDVESALAYTRDYCDSMFKTLYEVSTTLGRIKTGTNIL
jgi:hypothetical protein